MNTVGHTVSTITDFSRHLDSENGKRPAANRKDENARAVKLLSSIVFPESLHRDAVKELRATGARREFHHGAPNYDRTANVVEDMVGTIGVPHMLNDNKAAIDMIHKPGVTKKSVHYERWIHFARELHLSGRMKYFWCSTVQMMADGFTKVVDKATFLKGRAYYMNIETAS